MALKLQVASPCSADWESMAGDERVRYCSQCSLSVYNLSSLTERELKRLIREREGLRLCGRLYRRADGTILTADCHSGVKHRIARVSRLAIASLSAAMSVAVAHAQTSAPQSLVQIAPVESGVELELLDPSGAEVRGASVSLTGSNLTTPISGVTDEHGRWRIFGITPGKYGLLVNAPGFSSALRSLTVPEHDALPVQIKLQVVGVATTGILVSEVHRNPLQKFVHFFKRL